MFGLSATQLALLQSPSQQIKAGLAVGTVSPLRYCTGVDAIQIDGNWYTEPDNAPLVADFTQGENSGITFVAMKDVDYDDDETWNTFLTQLTVEEMAPWAPAEGSPEAAAYLAGLRRLFA